MTQSREELAQAIIEDIKRVALELGRTPTRIEYCDKHMGAYNRDTLTYAIGSWTIALQQCGLKLNGGSRSKAITNEQLFGRDIEEHIEEYKPAEHVKIVPKCETLNTTAIIGDLHFPFVDQRVLDQFYKFLETTKPKRCIQMGDLYDMLAHTKFARSQNIYTPAQEMELGFKMALAMWTKIREIVPGIECHQILGNHDIRPLKRILDKYPEGEIFFSIDKWFQFDGVTTNMDYRKELILDGVIYHHGYMSQLGAHRDYNIGNTVVAHTHTGGVVFRSIRDEICWELNAGYMGDPTSKALGYTAQRMVRWTPGWGYIDNYGPRFIPCKKI